MSTKGNSADDGTSGIDLFANLVKHELFHVAQIARADALLGQFNGQANTPWEYGWSWKYKPTNHWLPNGVNLDADNNDVPDAWGQGYDVEVKAREQQTIAENTYRDKDFGYPDKRAGHGRVSDGEDGI